MAIIGTDINEAKRLLESGELVAIPTETVYGLAGHALDPDVVLKIFSAKNRPFFDPMIVHVSSPEQARNFASSLPAQAEKLIERFWPGPLTIVVPKRDLIPDLVTAGLDRVGLRCPKHEMTLALLKQLSFPLAAPSANPFGYVSPTRAEHVMEQLGDKVGYILDGGPCTLGVESTIIGWEDDKAIIYRLGGISPEEIEDVIGRVKVIAHSSSKPQSPGMLKSHYAPIKKFLLGDIEELTKKVKSGRIGVLSFQKMYPVDSALHQVLSQAGDLNEAARNLFAMMRTLDQSDVETIVAEEVPNTGIGRAINDRLRRAAAGS